MIKQIYKFINHYKPTLGPKIISPLMRDILIQAKSAILLPTPATFVCWQWFFCSSSIHILYPFVAAIKLHCFRIYYAVKGSMLACLLSAKSSINQTNKLKKSVIKRNLSMIGHYRSLLMPSDQPSKQQGHVACN